MNYSKITLVGAGPGDTELITLKGLKAIQTADVILYDDLVNTDLLDYAPSDCKKFYVGKRGGELSTKQDDINAMLVYYAQQYGHVVRLKGGDSFIFGRGFEEIAYASEQGIATEVIPGISSFYAVPELCNIPLTTRGVSRSFYVTTATTATGELSEEIRHAATINATVVILMGIGKLKEIAELFMQEGKAELPVALIQNGSLPTQRTVKGTIQTIGQLAIEADIKAPAIIVIGEVVALGDTILYHQYNEVAKSVKSKKALHHKLGAMLKYNFISVNLLALFSWKVVG